MGKWKAVQQPIATAIRLYDLDKDLGEKKDVAGTASRRRGEDEKGHGGVEYAVGAMEVSGAEVNALGEWGVGRNTRACW